MATVTQDRVTLWQAWLKSRDSETFLTVDARRVIGILYSVAEPTPMMISQATQIPFGIVKELLEQVDNDGSFVIRRALASGLPIEAVVELPAGGRKLICKRCRQRLSVVPCCRCLLKGEIARSRVKLVKRKKEKREKDPPQSKEPTHAPPGSMEKISVMRERASSGFSVFCRGDRRIISKISRWSQIPPHMRRSRQ